MSKNQNKNSEWKQRKFISRIQTKCFRSKVFLILQIIYWLTDEITNCCYISLLIPHADTSFKFKIQIRIEIFPLSAAIYTNSRSNLAIINTEISFKTARISFKYAVFVLFSGTFTRATLDPHDILVWTLREVQDALFLILARHLKIS